MTEEELRIENEAFEYTTCGLRKSTFRTLSAFGDWSDKMAAMAKSYKNTVLPEIKLKYFKRPDIHSRDFQGTNYICYGCRLVDIPIVGAIRDGYSDNPKYYCEDCAINNYMIEFDFESREAAASWRRRIFDVGYLLHELIIERYLKENNKTYEALNELESDMLLNTYRDLYNKISRSKKEDLESIVEQGDLEEELQKYCKKVKFR